MLIITETEMLAMIKSYITNKYERGDRKKLIGKQYKIQSKREIMDKVFNKKRRDTNQNKIEKYCYNKSRKLLLYE